MHQITGLIAAPYTPFDAQGQLQNNLIPIYAQYLKDCGISGVFVNGTTGEGASLSLAERMQSAEVWVAQQTESFQVLIHVGHNSLPEARELARHAQTLGATGIGALAPAFFKAENLEALIRYQATIASAAPELPFYYYHIPSMTGVQFPMIDFLRLATPQIPQLAGIKYTHHDLMDMKLCLECAEGSYSILHGRDEVLLSGLALGVKGAIGSTYNYLGPLFKKLIAAFEAGKLSQANELQLAAMKLIQVLIKYGGAVKAGKTIMRMVGLDFGAPRLPVQGLSAGEAASLEQELEDLNFRSYSLMLPNSRTT